MVRHGAAGKGSRARAQRRVGPREKVRDGGGLVLAELKRHLVCWDRFPILTGQVVGNRQASSIIGVYRIVADDDFVEDRRRRVFLAIVSFLR